MLDLCAAITSKITIDLSVDRRPGSVKVRYRVGWSFKEGVRNPPDPITVDTLKQRLEDHLRANNGRIYNYRVPLHSLQAQRETFCDIFYINITKLAITND